MKNNPFVKDIVGMAVDFKKKSEESKKARIKKSIKQQDFSDFDKLIEDFGNNAQAIPDKPVKDVIKSRIFGNEVMTDSQHRFIIALFTNELNWTARNAFNFILKVIPQLRSRLKARVIRETDIQAMYQELKKSEASKLINIIKSILRRKKNDKGYSQKLPYTKNKN